VIEGILIGDQLAYYGGVLDQYRKALESSFQADAKDHEADALREEGKTLGAACRAGQ
jgi:hypothetical protein